MVKVVFDDGAGCGHRLGMIVLSTDETLEYEARQVLDGRCVNLMHSRIESHPQVTPDTLKEMRARMPEVARLLPAGLDAIAYGCTSASVVIGPEVVAREVQSVQADVPVTNPISAVVTALGALRARRIGLVTPYAAEVAAPMRQFLSGQGIDTLHEISFGEAEDRKVARIAQRSTLAAMLEVGRAQGVEAVFASCTNLGTFEVIDQAEDELGIPVISSNLALVWHLLKLAGIEARGWGPGRLFHL
ncbi:aspartate/glutamate racemase family protein [uncultured Roseovarius sp.]|uniref:maleate cis-trans isomerase family protein n=1 Tax=uncultured Roseovarius sp. TaxID=293344 RepID=UPI00261B6DB2|nr:aspartate/glutamate racemase family protein [uncultured Roseovarius sp.]